MTPTLLRTILRQAMVLTLPPMIPAMMSCGGRVEDGTHLSLIDANIPRNDTSAQGSETEPDAASDTTTVCTPIFQGTPAVCGTTRVTFPCGVPPVSNPGPTGSPTDTCNQICKVVNISGDPAFFQFNCTIVSSGSPAVVDCMALCLGGHRPAMFEPQPVAPPHDGAGSFLATAAQLEAASVDAFLILRDELTFHGAPESLINDANRAAHDEMQHAQTVERLANLFGSKVPAVNVARTEKRSLEKMALENAVEGCVRETFAVAVALHQAEHAQHPDVAREMRSIAEDELQHASLSWRLKAWLDTQLDEAAQNRVREAMQDAVISLENDVVGGNPGDLVSTLGLPTPGQTLVWIDALKRSLWQFEASHA